MATMGGWLGYCQVIVTDGIGELDVQVMEGCSSLHPIRSVYLLLTWRGLEEIDRNPVEAQTGPKFMERLLFVPSQGHSRASEESL